MPANVPVTPRAASAAGVAEPVCRNCGANAPGAYCPACGQDTRERLPTFTQFMRDAMGRYVAFDGKLWKTLAALLFRPGFLTREYFAGRRQRYVGPARLFLVSSLVLFAALRFASESIDIAGDLTRGFAEGYAQGGLPARASSAPSAAAESGLVLDEDLNLKVGDLPERLGVLKKPIARFNALPRPQKLEQILAGALRYGPYAMFALLPAFAALLKLLYLRRRERYPHRPRLYGEHLVFAAHNHAFLFAAGTLLVAIPPGMVHSAVGFWAIAYLLWSMHAVYRGSRLGIAVRALALLVAYAVLFSFATVGLLVAAILLR